MSRNAPLVLWQARPETPTVGEDSKLSGIGSYNAAICWRSAYAFTSRQKQKPGSKYRGTWTRLLLCVT